MFSSKLGIINIFCVFFVDSEFEMNVFAFVFRIDCTALKPQIESVEQQIVAAKKDFPSWDNGMALNDLKTQKKRLVICENQVNMVNTALVSVLEKNFLDKYHNVAKVVHGLVEKIKWCDPTTISDNFSLEAKKASLKEVEDGVKESHEKLPPLQEAFKVLKGVPDYSTKLNEHGETLSKILNDLMIVETNHKRMQAQFNDLADLWRSFDKDSDEIGGWLKDFETIVRSETLSQINLPDLQQKIQETQNLLRDVASCEAKLKSLNDTSNKIVKISPESRTGQTYVHLSHRVAAVAKFVNSLKDKLSDLSSNKEKFDKLLKESNNYIDTANNKITSLDKSGASHQSKVNI
jgi:DNA repair ATPase RecN